MTGEQRVAEIKELLTAALAPQRVEVTDDSHLHVGHRGARGGGGHFTVMIVSESFSGKKLLERHRMVYDALSRALETEIHALSIQAYSPDEVNQNP
jgi:BolA protein